MATTHYQSSKGAVEIASMPYTYASNALAKLRREDPSRLAEIAALADHVVTLEGEREAGEAAPMGHNNPPPEPAPKPGPQSFPAIKAHLDDLLAEARNWADGVPIANQAQADEVARLSDQLRDAATLAEDARKAEREPHDTVVEEIQARYNAYIAPLKNRTPGKVSLALDALKATQTAWLRALEAAQKAEAARLALEAQAKLDAAAEALKASSGNIEAREEAEALFTDAKVTERAAVSASNVRAHAFGDGKATSLRDNWTVQIANGTEALRWAWARYRPELESYAIKLAQAEVRNGVRSLPGFTISNERRVA